MSAKTNTFERKSGYGIVVISMIISSLCGNYVSVARAEGMTQANKATNKIALSSQEAEKAEDSAASPERAASPKYQNGSVMFIENVGQFSEGAGFQVRGGNSTLWLAEDGIWVTVMEEPPASEPPAPMAGEEGFLPPTPLGNEAVLGDNPRRGVNLRLSFVGANPMPRLEPFNRLETSVNYFIGNDPSNWFTNIPVWGGVRYTNLYPGIDLEINGEDGQIVQKLVAHDGADLTAVRLQVDGADEMDLQADHLVLTTTMGKTILPLIRVSGVDHAISPSPMIVENQISFPFDYLESKAVINYPQSDGSPFSYSTFLGGSSFDSGNGIAVDSSGAAYVIGQTLSSDFPTSPGSFDRSLAGEDVFVVKLNESGSELEYATFLGGSGSGDLGQGEEGNGIDVDSSGSAYITGSTFSSDFPTTPWAFDTSLAGEYGLGLDAFAAKLNASGSSLEYSTYLGGSSGEKGVRISIDPYGSAYILGMSYSSDFPTTPGAFDTSFDGNDVFVVKLNSSGSALDYATALGGSAAEYGGDIDVDSSGSAYVTGYTYSSDFPTTPGAFDRSFNGTDVFVVKLNTFGSALDYATALGGSAAEYGGGIDVDSSGSAYVTGYTYSSDFPTTPGAFDTSPRGSNAFVVKFDEIGSAVVYATFLGENHQSGNGINVDSSGSAYISGSSSIGSTIKVFVMKLNTSGSALDYDAILGGSNSDYSEGISVNSLGVAYIIGRTFSYDFPTTPGAFDRSFNGRSDAFVMKLPADYGGFQDNLIYAIPGGATSGSCESWANACELRYALMISNFRTEVWVAAGTYTPSANGDRTTSFPLKVGVDIYGGFIGTETDRNQRDPAANLTILSGDLLGNDGEDFANNGENSFHVVTGASGALLDGFTIRGGNANGATPNDEGGGMYIVDSSPMLANIIFNDNSARIGGGLLNRNEWYKTNPTLTDVTFSGNSASLGGGIFNDCSDPTLTRVTFTNNSADSGGGIYNKGVVPYYCSSSVPHLTDVTFSGNSASFGGGIFSENSSPTLTNVSFNGNSAGSGGGIYNWSDSDEIVSFPVLMNVTFSDNTAVNSGGGIFNNLSSPSLTNVTFDGNTASKGGGLYNYYFSNPMLTNVTLSGNTASFGGGLYNYFSSNPLVRNSILWNNGGGEIYNDIASPSVSDSVVMGGYAGGANIITADPILGTLSNNEGYTQTIPLLAGSSAIDVGSDETCPNTDQRGLLRPQGQHCDIGAYEVLFPAPSKVRASDGTYTGKIQVTWNAYSEATSYEVYRAESVASAKNLLSNPHDTTFDDITAVPFVPYYYWVKACNGTICTDYSGYDTGWRNLGAPVNVQASDGTYTDKVQVTWNAISEATYYEVYRDDGGRNLLGSTMDTTYDDTSIPTGIAYNYGVKACNYARCSDFSAFDKGWRKIIVLIDLQASDGTYTDKVRVSWTTSLPQGTIFHVYRNTGPGDTILLGSVSESPFDDATATPGVTYNYWVEGCNGTNCVPSYYDTGWRNLFAPANVAVSDGTFIDKVQVIWTLSSSATSYKVYRAASASGAKTLRGSSATSPFNDTNPTPGVTYFYWVVACNGSNCSDYSAYDTGWRNFSAPANVVASDGTFTDKVQVAWDAVIGASSYQVYRAEGESVTKSLLGSPTASPANDSSATPGITYYYWVKACRGANCSDYSAYDSGWCNLSAPAGVAASDGPYTDKVQVTWNAASGAVAYRVYRATSATGSKTWLGSSTGTSYPDASAIPGITYYYWVKTCTATLCSDFSASDTGWRKPTAPAGLTASDGTYTDKVLISWTASPGATSYQVYRATSATGTKAGPAATASTTTNDASATPGVTYYYFVKACRGANCSDYSAYDTGWRTIAPPTNVQASDGTFTDKVRLTWTASPGATSYKLYRATSAGGTKTLLGSTTGTAANDTTATPGTTYYYWVTACRGSVCSDYSAYDTGYRRTSAADLDALPDLALWFRERLYWDSV